MAPANKFVTTMLVVLLSLLLLLMTNIRAYVVFKANKRVTQSFLFHESVVAGFRDLSELVGPAFMTVESNVVNSSVKMHKLTLLFRRIRRDRSSAYNSTAYKINADDDRHSTILEYKDLSARSMSQPHHNKSVEMFNTASNSLTTIVDINISLPQSISATSDLFRVPMEWLSVQDAGARGRGLFALHAIENNSLLGEYIGEVLSQRQYSARYPKGHSEYTFLVSQEAQRRDRIYVDAADESKSNIFRFVNHDSVNPNVRVEVIYEEKNTMGMKNYNKLISNEIEDKTLVELELEENHGTEKPRSVATEKEENSKKKNTWKSKSKSKSKSKQRQFEIRMTALRDIKKGEEMCFDYGPLYSPSAGWAL